MQVEMNTGGFSLFVVTTTKRHSWILNLYKYNEGNRRFKRYDVLIGGSIYAQPVNVIFILHLFYLSSHIALPGYFFVIFDHWPRNSFLVPDSCWTTIRNNNSMYAYKLISADFTEDILKNDQNDACFFSF